MVNNEASATNKQGMQAVIGLTGFTSELGDFRVHKEQLTRIELPANFTNDDIELMKKDFATIIKIAEQKPQDFLSISNAVLRYDSQSVNQLARKIGLTEENLRANGGAWVGAVVGAVVLLVVLGALLESDSPPPPPPPPSSPDGGSG
jgi:hypothetical protein